MSDVTRILSQIDAGNPAAAEELLPLVYDELRKLAAAKLAHEKPGQTLQPTALVHEAYLRLVATSDQAATSGEQKWNSHGHFFGAAAEAMRRILVEQARGKARLKRGGDRKRVNLEEATSLAPEAADDLLSLDEALTKLADEDPVKAKLVKMRYFAGLQVTEAADALGISRATAHRYWAYAKVWLYCQITGEEKPADL